MAGYRKDCAAYEAPNSSGAGAPSLRVPAGKPGAASRPVRAGRLRANATAQAAAFRRLRSGGGATANNARRLAGLIEANIGLRFALAPGGPLRAARLALRDFPKPVRRRGWTARYVNKPVSKVLTDPALLKAERGLVAVLRAYPL